MTVLEELTLVMLATPGPHASDDEVAAWHEHKAHLLEHIAAGAGPDAEEARRQAALARRHALALRETDSPRQDRGRAP